MYNVHLQTGTPTSNYNSVYIPIWLSGIIDVTMQIYKKYQVLQMRNVHCKYYITVQFHYRRKGVKFQREVIITPIHAVHVRRCNGNIENWSVVCL